jgi:hypothetical protein
MGQHCPDRVLQIVPRRCRTFPPQRNIAVVDASLVHFAESRQERNEDGNLRRYCRMCHARQLLFGVCANEYAPDDGRVVSLDHGCGAHSEALASGPGFGTIAPVIDEVGYDLVDMPGVALADTVFESLDHGEE